MTLPWALPLLIVMQTRSAGVSPRPVAWAAQSPRPSLCLATPGLWEVSRQAQQGVRCRELARAQALLLGAPAKARDRAASLLARTPDFSEARVVRGRASLRTGDTETALRDLLPLLQGDAATVADPGALLDGGRAALAQKDLGNAARFYRALGSRASLLPDRAQQVRAYVEIAATLLATETTASDDALAFLREARRRSPGSGLTGLCAVLSAVAWLSEGREAEAQGALSDAGAPETLASVSTQGAVRLPDGMWDVALAVATERSDPEQSLKHYAAVAQSPLAKTKLGSLGTRARGRGAPSGERTTTQRGGT